MRRRYPLLTLIPLLAAAIVVIACGGSSGDASAAKCDFSNTPRTPPSQRTVISSYTLEEARRQVDFEIYAPEELPPGVTLTGVTVIRSSFCPDRAPSVQLNYRGSMEFLITEGRGIVGFEATPVRIGNADAMVTHSSTVGGYDLAIVEWKRGEVVISAVTRVDLAL
jgi:hypothetical protein